MMEIERARIVSKSINTKQTYETLISFVADNTDTKAFLKLRLTGYQIYSIFHETTPLFKINLTTYNNQHLTLHSFINNTNTPKRSADTLKVAPNKCGSNQSCPRAIRSSQYLSADLPRGLLRALKPSRKLLNLRVRLREAILGYSGSASKRCIRYRSSLVCYVVAAVSVRDRSDLG